MSSQKEIFLKSEADAWFERNHQAILSREFNDKSPIISELRSCLDSFPQGGGSACLK
jgi:hypothetical protein